jgi:DNA-binding MarR family transcriptional regulator
VTSSFEPFPDPPVDPVDDDDYRRLLAFRDTLRRFQHWSEEQAAAAGLTPAQHQLLLVVRATRAGGHLPASVGTVAEHLMLRHHSAAELVDRTVKAGLLRKVRGAIDGRMVLLFLTPDGERRLRELAALHLAELRTLAPVVAALGEF